MNDYKKIELEDIMNNPSAFDGQDVEITGVVVAVESVTSGDSTGRTINEITTRYNGFLQQKGELLLISGYQLNDQVNSYHLAMLNASAKTSIPISLQGTLTKLSKEKNYIYSKDKLPYELEVKEIAFANYLTDGYQIRDNTND